MDTPVRLTVSDDVPVGVELTKRDVQLSSVLEHMVLLEEAQLSAERLLDPSFVHTLSVPCTDRTTLSLVAEYLSHKRGVDTSNVELDPRHTAWFKMNELDRAIIDRAMRRDKLGEEVSAGLTTLEEVNEKQEREIQLLLSGRQMTLAPYSWPKLPSSFNNRSVRDRLERQFKRHTPVKSSRREGLFDLLRAANYLGITGLLNLCAWQINRWRTGPVICHDWAMARGTRWERLSAVQLMLLVDSENERLKRKWRIASLWWRLPTLYEVEKGAVMTTRVEAITEHVRSSKRLKR